MFTCLKLNFLVWSNNYFFNLQSRRQFHLPMREQDLLFLNTTISMVYCTHCGKEQPEPISLRCSFGGKQNLINSISNQSIQIKQQLAEFGYKNPVTAAFLGLVVPGLGHVYDGNIGFGICLLLCARVVESGSQSL